MINPHFQVYLPTFSFSIIHTELYIKMGGGDCFGARRSIVAIEQQDLLAIPTAQIDTHLKPQYFLLITQVQHFHSNYEEILKQTYPNLKLLRDRQLLQAQQQDDHNKILVICCNNGTKLKEIRSLYNFHSFSKIGVAYSFYIDDINEMRTNLQKELGFRFKNIFRDDVQEIKKFFQSANQKQSIYFCHKNMGMINRTNVLFHYFFRKDYKHSQARFLNWLESKTGGKSLAETIKSKNDDEQALQLFLVDNLFSESALLKQALDLLAKTRNPGIIANISWFLSLIFRFIKKSYEKTLKKLNKSEFVVWLRLTNQEIKTLRSSQGQNLMFSTFVIGETDKNYVPSQRSDNLYRIYINIPKEINKFDKELDLGFYYNENKNKVIFNLLNTYHIDSVHVQDKTINVTYSSIGFQYNLRNSQFRYSKDAKKGNIRMMKLYDYYCLNRIMIKDQFDLVFALQMYQKYKKITNIRLTKIKKSTNNEMASTRANSSIQESPQNRFNQYLGDCQLQCGNHNQALSYYEKVMPPQRGLMKMMHIFNFQKNGRRFRQTMQQLRKLQPQRAIRKQVKFTKIAMNNFVAKMICNSGELDKASKKIHQTLAEMSKAIENYHFHNESYVSFPLYYLLQKTSSQICQLKGETEQAEIIQKQCASNELIFDGIHKIWLHRQ